MSGEHLTAESARAGPAPHLLGHAAPSVKPRPFEAFGKAILLWPFAPAAAGRSLRDHFRPSFALFILLELVITGLILYDFMLLNDPYSENQIRESVLNISLLTALCAAIAAVAAWIAWPRVHRYDSAGRSFALALTLTAAAIPWIVALVSIVLGLMAYDDYMLRRGESGALNDLISPLRAEEVFSVTIPAVIALIALQFGRLAQGAASESLPAVPRCEFCGYDLTHRPAEDRCPECGHAVTKSLDAARARGGAPWQARRGLDSLVHATADLWFEPRGFYRSLHVRSPANDANRFAAVQYTLLGVGAAIWFLVIVWLRQMQEPRFVLLHKREAIYIPLMLMTLFPLLCWLGHRLGGSIVFTCWVWSRSVDDFRIAAKVIAYESAFLWAYAVCWGGMIFAIVLFQNEISRFLGGMRPRLLGFPIQIWLVMGVTAALSLLWIIRYRIAMRSVRWSNF